MSADLLKQVEIILRKGTDLEEEFEKQEAIEQLELAISSLNEAANEGKELVADGIYDTLVERLRMLDPSNPLLHSVWSESVAEDFDDYDEWLMKYPMLSIQTIKGYLDTAYLNFKKAIRRVGTAVRAIASLKINGHGVRLIYNNGYLVKSTTRGRSTSGRDITRHMKLILGEYNEGLADLGMTELRAEVALPFSNFDKAKEFNPTVKSAFTAVSSMIRESASDEEVRLLHVLVYDILTENREFYYLSEKVDFLDSAGFETPAALVISLNAETLDTDLNELLMSIENRTSEYDYYTDGVVIQVDNIQVFLGMGQEDKFRLGNIALKMGKWEQNTYYGTVIDIAWEEGKTKITPVAILEGVLTATGATTSRVPLYTPANILLLRAYKGNQIHFRFGGESGVVPCFPDGSLLKEQKDENAHKTGRMIDVDGHKHIVYDNEDWDIENDDEYVFG